MSLISCALLNECSSNALYYLDFLNSYIEQILSINFYMLTFYILVLDVHLELVSVHQYFIDLGGLK